MIRLLGSSSSHWDIFMTKQAWHKYDGQDVGVFKFKMKKRLKRVKMEKSFSYPDYVVVVAGEPADRREKFKGAVMVSEKNRENFAIMLIGKIPKRGMRLVVNIFSTTNPVDFDPYDHIRANK